VKVARKSASISPTRGTASSTDTPRVLVVYKKTAWQTNVKERRNPRYLQLVKEGHQSVERLEAAHRAHQETLEETHRALDALGVRSVFRFRGDEGLVEGFDLVVTVGGDGTLLWAARWVGPEQPVVAINSAPGDSVGHFCAGRKGSVEASLAAAISGRLRAFQLTRMSVELDGEVVTRRVLNDVLFAHSSPAATTRYLVRVDEGRRIVAEEHKSSGLWVDLPRDRRPRSDRRWRRPAGRERAHPVRGARAVRARRRHGPSAAAAAPPRRHRAATGLDHDREQDPRGTPLRRRPAPRAGRGARLRGRAPRERGAAHAPRLPPWDEGRATWGERRAAWDEGRAARDEGPRDEGPRAMSGRKR
jgi:hypothetical protein